MREIDRLMDWCKAHSGYEGTVAQIVCEVYGLAPEELTALTVSHAGRRFKILEKYGFFEAVEYSRTADPHSRGNPARVWRVV